MSRQNRGEIMTEREDIEMLLPWYVTGKLEAEDREKVDAYLAAHPDIADQLEMIGEDIDATIELNEMAGAPSAGALSRLLEQVDEKFGTGKSASGPGWLATQFGRLMQSFDMPAVRYAAMAAAVVIAVQAIAIGSLINTGQSPAGYELASGQNGNGKGALILVSFVPQATIADISGLLEDIEAVVVSGPRGQGLYEIRIQNEDATQAEVDKIVETLNAREKLVNFASVSE